MSHRTRAVMICRLQAGGYAAAQATCVSGEVWERQVRKAAEAQKRRQAVVSVGERATKSEGQR